MKKTDFEFRIKRRHIKAGPDENRNDFPGYQEYPPDEDIYSKDKQESAIDPEDISGDRTFPKTGVSTESAFDPYLPDIDLDIPGVDLDDELETVGSEDEENNYYSIADNYDELEDILER